MDVWLVEARRGRSGVLETIAWWELRRPVFNAILLAACIPGVLLLLLVSLIRVWVFRFAGGTGLFLTPINFSLLIGAVFAANIAYTAVCWIEVLVQATSRESTASGLELWQFCVMFSLVAVALSFFLSLPFALGLMPSSAL
jgi:hypothetical protein